jgi:hypothetical protein
MPKSSTTSVGSKTGSSASTSASTSTPMTQSAASRIQSSQAKSGGNMSSSGFAARAQSSGAKNSK